MLTPEAIRTYLDATVTAIKADAAQKNQAIPDAFRVEVGDDGGKLYAPDYFKYLVLGRRPGKRPPPDAMLAYVKKHPGLLVDARYHFKNITEKSLAFLIGRKIGREGTNIFSGKKPGVDFLGAMEVNMPALLATIARNEAVKVLTVFKSEINGANRSIKA